MADHGTRVHATWSASSTSRNWACPGALALSSQVADLDVESEAAAWGTACHQLSEKCLRVSADAETFIGQTETTKRHSFEVDEEMAECAQTYIDYVRERAGPEGWLGENCRVCNGTGETVERRKCSDCGGTGELYGRRTRLYIEKRFSLEKLDPPFDAGGTADAVVYFPEQKLLEVIDLKGGRGIVVEATENKQLRTYALGAMLAFPGLAVESVMSTIVQPRARHKEGVIRSETIHVADLLGWAYELLDAMKRSAKAAADYAKIAGDVTREQWADLYLKAGEHCTFCPAAGFCPALEKRAVEAAGVWFDDLDRPQLSNTPDGLSPEKLAQTLDMAGMIQDWLNACRALATRLAETGVEIPGYQLSDKIGNRKFTDLNAVKTLLITKGGLAADEIYAEPKFKSPAQIEKALGAKRLKPIATEFEALVSRPVTGTTLVSKAKTTKPAKQAAVNAFFSPID